MTLADLFRATCDKHGSKRALVWGDGASSFDEVRERAERLAAGLRASGIERHDRVAIFLPNSPDTLTAHLGAILAGAARVPVNALYTAREARHPIEVTQGRLVVADEERLPIAEEAVRPVDPSPAIVTVPDLLARGVGKPVPPVAVDPGDLTLVCFTSGTSGKPKGVPLTHANLVSNIEALVSIWEWTGADTLLLCLPLMHLHGLGNGLNGWIATGCRLVLHARFEPVAVLRAIEERAVTLFFGVPAMYTRLLAEPSFRSRDLSSVRLWVSGSAPLPRALAERFEETVGARICNRYGMTETAMITANPYRGERRPGSVGRPLPGVDVRIVDPRSGSDLGVGEEGEIAVRGPSVAAGYWGGETDAGSGHRAGLFHTGDLGYRDSEGYVFVTGRAKEIVISGGTNVSPREIEEVIEQCPGVREAAAFGIPDPTLGEVLCAVVVPADAALTEKAVREHCERGLAKFKRPRVVRLTAEPLPRNAMGKLDRKKVREIHGR